jgi:hypothetical protein
MSEIENLHEKITKSYKRMKEKATKRKKKKKKGSTNWEPRINDKVLLRCQHTSDAKQGVISKSVQNYISPSFISDTNLPSIHELSDMQGKDKRQISQGQLKTLSEGTNR